jgi:hypothetical protein
LIKGCDRNESPDRTPVTALKACVIDGRAPLLGRLFRT